MVTRRVPIRSAGMISSRYPADILSTLCSFFEAVTKLNEEACGDRPHPTPITGSVGELADTYQDY